MKVFVTTCFYIRTQGGRREEITNNIKTRKRSKLSDHGTIIG